MKPETEKKITHSLKFIKGGLICSGVLVLYSLITIMEFRHPFPIAVALCFFCWMFTLNKLLKDIIKSEQG